jgi:ABC-type microcin C transport system permease subunit YejB
VLNRDYPVVFANLYIFALVGLVVNLISDLTYTWIDPRIETRGHSHGPDSRPRARDSQPQPGR